MLFPEASYIIAPTPSDPKGRAIPASLLVNGVATNMESFPCISEQAFRDFENSVPHLFRDGLALLGWLDAALDSSKAAQSLAITRVIRGLVLTAGVCAPPDLWLMYYLLGLHPQSETKS